MMKDYELDLVVRLLRMAASTFSRQGCNDLCLGFLTKEKQIELQERISAWNGDEVDYVNPEWTQDWLLARYLAHKIVENELSRDN